MWLEILIQQILLHEEYWSTSSGKIRCGGEDCHSWEHWPTENPIHTNVIEERRTYTTLVNNELLQQFSSFTRLIRVIAICLRLRGARQ